MNKACFLLLAASMAAGSGCLNISLGSRRPSPPPTVVAQGVPITTADTATLAEIDASARLSFDNARHDALTQLAKRQGLSPVAQVHLINTTYRCLSFDSSKLGVLNTLIANASFCDAARQAIVTQLDHLSFDSNKQAILQVLNQRVTS